jgi:hypothetical protein
MGKQRLGTDSGCLHAGGSLGSEWTGRRARGIRTHRDRTIRRKEYDLVELVKAIPSRNLLDEIDFSGPVGKEIW